MAEAEGASPAERRKSVLAAERIARLASKRLRAGRHVEQMNYAASTLRRSAELLGLKTQCPALFEPERPPAALTSPRSDPPR